MKYDANAFAHAVKRQLGMTVKVQVSAHSFDEFLIACVWSSQTSQLPLRAESRHSVRDSAA